MVFDANYAWQPIGTAPVADRIMVCGWSEQSPSGTAAYWWYEEDVTFNGEPAIHPHAEYWAPLVIPPFPIREAQP